MFGLFKKSAPPKTTLENFVWVPHVEEVFSWFLKNDFQVQQILSPTIKKLFEDGYRPEIEISNDPKIIKEQSGGKVPIKYAHGWLSIRIWMDLNNIRKASEQGDLKTNFEHVIDMLDQYGKHTLMTAGEIVHKYDMDPLIKDLDLELAKITSEEEKESFKQNFLADTLNSTEVRILAWIYRELFNAEYMIKP